MSKTFTNRTSTTRAQAGRGRKPPSIAMQGGKLGTKNTDSSDEASSSQQTQQQRMEHRGSYTVITPNEKKRQQINQHGTYIKEFKKAAKETAAYEKHKEQSRLGYVSYTGTVGGASVNEDTARRKLQEEQRKAKYDRLRKSEKWRQERKDREDLEFQKKKDEQRRKAQANAQKGVMTETDRDEVRRQRLAYFENKT